METLETLNTVFRDVFGDPTISVQPDTTADEVEGWDSMSHVTLILAIEARFRIKFMQKELMSFRKVGDLVRSIEFRASPDTPSPPHGV